MGVWAVCDCVRKESNLFPILGVGPAVQFSDYWFVRMPKKTRQYGWQCSECDRVPEQNPSSFKPADPAVDLEAPRSSRTRTTRTGSIQGNIKKFQVRTLTLS